MPETEPFTLPVEFTGNGVISQGKFFPYKIGHITIAYPHLDAVSNGFLAIKRVWVQNKQTTNTNNWVIMEGYLRNISSYLGYWNWETAIPNISYSHQTYEIVLDRNTSLDFTSSVGGQVWDCFIIYSEIDYISEIADGYKQKPCGVFDWLQGECIHGNT